MSDISEQSSKHSQRGFTIVEVVVTLVILSLFLIVFFTTYMALESQRINVARQAKANDIAYNNLRKFPSRPSGLTCPTDPAGTVLSNATYNFTPEPSTQSLGTSTQTVTAYAPNGCDPSDSTKFKDGIVKIVSKVTYGTDGEVSHASYVQ